MNDLEAQVRQDLWNAIKKHYISNDFTEALRDAAFLLKDVLQNKSGEYDKDNAKLVEATLNGSNPILKVNSFSTQSEKDFQAGIALGIKGIFMHVSLAMFFHFFAEHFYIPLKRVVKLRIEDLVYQGIENGMYKTNETEGNYSIVATWAAEHIQKFETSAKCIDLIRKKSLCTQDGCSYILMYFKSFVDLHNDENRIAIDKIINEQAFNENIYKFIRHFVFDKTDKLYLHYKEKIDEYENKYVAEQDRIPEEFDLPF